VTKRQGKLADAAQSQTDLAALGVSIYQNPDYVVGLLQQMVQRGRGTTGKFVSRSRGIEGRCRYAGDPHA